MAPERVSAVIIRDKRILLVTGYDESFYWTPGGKVDPMEDRDMCLTRELQEELCIKPVSIRHYIDYISRNQAAGRSQTVHCYLVEVAGEPVPNKEITKFVWYSKGDFESCRLRLAEGVRDKLFPRLIQDDLL